MVLGMVHTGELVDGNGVEITEDMITDENRANPTTDHLLKLEELYASMAAHVLRLADRVTKLELGGNIEGVGLAPEGVEISPQVSFNGITVVKEGGEVPKDASIVAKLSDYAHKP